QLKQASIKLYFFFFQAEDGIRDLIVTGVQTCALPILAPGGSFTFTETRTLLSSDPKPLTNSAEGIFTLAQNLGNFSNRIHAPSRSEERRVGKECKSRWSGDH